MTSRHWFFLFFLILGTLAPLGALDLKDFAPKMPSWGEGIPLFPEPYEVVLESMSFPEEQIVYLFRERCRAQHGVNQKKDNQANTYLVRALDRAWRAKSVEVRSMMQKDPTHAVNRFEAIFAGLPAEADRGAFSFLLNAMPEELFALSKMAPVSRDAALALREPAALSEYVAKIDQTTEFFRKRPAWKIKLHQAKTKVEQVFDRLQEAFSLEDLIMAVNWLNENNLLPKGYNAAALAGRLTDRLVEKIALSLNAELAVGMAPDDVIAVERTVSPAGVMVKQGLYRGRIRRFVKQYQKVLTRNQLAWLEPARLKTLALISQTKKSVKDPDSLATLERMEQNFQELKTVMELKIGMVKILQEAVVGVFRKVGETLKVVDPDQILTRE